MDKEDARKLSPEQQKEKRKIALRMRMNGHEFAEIGETVGVHKPAMDGVSEGILSVNFHLKFTFEYEFQCLN